MILKSLENARGQIADSRVFVGKIGVNTNLFASVGMQPKTEAKETRLQSLCWKCYSEYIMSDYTDLLSNVRDYTETTSDVLTDAIINQFIVSVEDKLRRTVDINYYRRYDTATLTVNNPFLPLPADWEATRYVQLIDGSDNRTFLIQKDISFINEYAPNRTSTGAGTPKYYAVYDDDTHMLAPTPNAALTVELAYTYKPPVFPVRQLQLGQSERSKRAFVWLYFRSTWILERSS